MVSFFEGGMSYYLLCAAARIKYMDTTAPCPLHLCMWPATCLQQARAAVNTDGATYRFQRIFGTCLACGRFFALILEMLRTKL